MTESDAHPVVVSAIIPARNEQAVIAACVQSLAVQREISEILVVNDQSTDATAAIVTREMQNIPKLRLLETHGLPAGWVGKNNAVWLGAREARGEWLLFTDADAVHNADSTARALGIAAREYAVLISYSPEQLMETWYEKALIPFVYSRLAAKFSFEQVNDPGNSAAAANGQFLLIRKDVYQAVGGHAQVASDVLEDVALAKNVKNAGYKIWFGTGKGIVHVRMYCSFGAMWEGWKKNLYLLMGGTAQTVTLEVIRALAPALAVFIVGVLLWLNTQSIGITLIVALVAILAVCLSYARRLRRNQFPARLAPYAIPAGLLFAGVLWASYRAHRKGSLEWKGREYPVGTPRASK
ncbi:MAG TPA: glycosyltransferase [Verrucomicrobiae bacterium]|nr:glycosyltransferase [Verrucomicrobiae bacterium]